MEDKISIEYFEKINIRIGTIIDAKDHPNADKLYILTIKFDSIENRTIVAGIKKYYEKEELINKQVTVIINLEKAEIRGIESQGMLLAAGEDEVAIIVPEKNIPNYSKVN